MVKEIKVYTRSTCAPCKMLKSWLKYKKITFREINVDDDREAMDEAYRISGLSMVPLTVVEKVDGTCEIISGYNLSSLTNSLA